MKTSNRKFNSKDVKTYLSGKQCTKNIHTHMFDLYKYTHE